MTAPPGRVPVIVVTGFLGSGKTTLLNRLLARRAARDASGKVALIVNELGEVGVDGDLLAGGARQVELPGGCVCCVLGDELDKTVIDLIDSQPGLDAIVLETTGVAEPLPIAWAFGRAPLDRAARLAVIVTLVDATELRSSRPVSPAVDEQIRHADVAVVTKAELAGPEATAAVDAVVRELAPHAPIVRGTTDEAAAWLESVIGDVDEYEHEHDHDHDHDHVHPVGHRVDSVWVPAPATLDLEELEDHLAALPGHYIRIKGIVRAADGRGGDPTPRWYAVHRVGLRVSSEPVSTPADARGRIVGLGPGVERPPLAACIAAAVLSSSDDGVDR
jgi:G3E family GTPase